MIDDDYLFCLIEKRDRSVHLLNKIERKNGGYTDSHHHNFKTVCALSNNIKALHIMIKEYSNVKEKQKRR